MQTLASDRPRTRISTRSRSSFLQAWALFLCVTLLGSSCATVFAQDTRQVMVTSNPPGASITVNGKAMGTTPSHVVVNDHETLQISIRKKGYHGSGCYINVSIRTVWLVVDLLLIYTVLPLAVDLITGEWASLDSRYCLVNLVPLQG